MSEVPENKSDNNKEGSSASQKVSLGKNLDLEEETLVYFPQQLGKIDLDEELKKLKEKYLQKTKGEEAMLYNYQNFGINYPINVSYRTTSMEYGFFPPNKATIAKKYFPKSCKFSNAYALGQKKGPSSAMNL